MTTAHKHYFVRGNTALGLHSLVESAFSGLHSIYVLQGYVGGTSVILKQLAQYLDEQGEVLHYTHDPLNSELLEGIIIPSLNIGLIDGNAWPEDTRLTEISDIQYVPIEESLDVGKLTQTSQILTRLQQQLKETYDTAYASFLKTLRIHDEWEKFYIDSLDREVMNNLAVEWSDTHLVQAKLTKPDPSDSLNELQDSNSIGDTVHRFLGAATYLGAVDYIMNLTDGISKRFYVKGRPGSGKSTLFKKIASIASERGIFTEMYHCGFDPNSLDMLIFPELSIAIFDSTAPHEHFPSREGDEIIDVYTLAIAAGTDEKYSSEIAPIKERYATSMQQSILYLAEAKEIYDRIAEVYLSASDLDHLLTHQQELQEKIAKL